MHYNTQHFLVWKIVALHANLSWTIAQGSASSKHRTNGWNSNGASSCRISKFCPQNRTMSNDHRPQHGSDVDHKVTRSTTKNEKNVQMTDGKYTPTRSFWIFVDNYEKKNIFSKKFRAMTSKNRRQIIAWNNMPKSCEFRME